MEQISHHSRPAVGKRPPPHYKPLPGLPRALVATKRPALEVIEQERASSSGSSVNSPTLKKTEAHRSVRAWSKSPFSGLLGLFRFAWMDGWGFEFTGVVFSISTITAAAVILAIFDQKSTSEWHSSVSLNAIISALITSAKASILLGVAACLSQEKWAHFSRPNSLHHIDVFEEASRGPLGATQLLKSTRSISKLTILGSVITILALGMEPFAQQVIQVPLRIREFQDENAAAINRIEMVNVGTEDTDLKPSVKAGMMSGLLGLSTSPIYTCTTGNCTFPDFKTIGLCSKCLDVTETTKKNCSSGENSVCHWNTPSNFNLTTVNQGGTMSPVSLQSTKDAEQQNLTVAGVHMPFVGFGMYKSLSKENGAHPSKKGEYEVQECAFYLCERTYVGVEVKAGIIKAEPDPSLDKQLFKTAFSFNETFVDLFYAWRTTAYQYLSFDMPHDANLKAKPKGANYTYGAMGFGALEGVLQMLFDNSAIENFNADYSITNKLNITQCGDIDSDAENRFDFMSFPLENAPIADVARNISKALTDTFTAMESAAPVAGTGQGVEGYFDIDWAWFVLPALIVLGGAAQFALTVALHRRRRTPLWKASSVALLLLDVDVGAANGLAAAARRAPAREHALHKLAKGYKASLACDLEEDEEGARRRAAGGGAGASERSIGTFVGWERKGVKRSYRALRFRHRSSYKENRRQRSLDLD